MGFVEARIATLVISVNIVTEKRLSRATRYTRLYTGILMF